MLSLYNAPIVIRLRQNGRAQIKEYKSDLAQPLCIFFYPYMVREEQEIDYFVLFANQRYIYIVIYIYIYIFSYYISNALNVIYSQANNRRYRVDKKITTYIKTVASSSFKYLNME